MTDVLITEEQAHALIDRFGLVGRGVPVAQAIMYWPKGVYEAPRKGGCTAPPPECVLRKNVSGYEPDNWKANREWLADAEPALLPPRLD